MKYYPLVFTVFFSVIVSIACFYFELEVSVHYDAWSHLISLKLKKSFSQKWSKAFLSKKSKWKLTRWKTFKTFEWWNDVFFQFPKSELSLLDKCHVDEWIESVSSKSPILSHLPPYNTNYLNVFEASPFFILNRNSRRKLFC